MECTCIIKFVINLTSTAIRMSGILRGHKKNFLHPLLKRHECPICLYAMRDPMQTECGHLFCKECLEPILATPNPECPLDRSAISADEVGVALLVHTHASEVACLCPQIRFFWTMLAKERSLLWRCPVISLTMAAPGPELSS